MVLDGAGVRRRRTRDEMAQVRAEVVRRSEAGEPLRSIARGLGLSRTSVATIMADHRGAPAAAVFIGKDGVARNALGIPVAEAEQINALVAQGYRYRDFSWHAPDGRRLGIKDWRDLVPAPGC